MHRNYWRCNKWRTQNIIIFGIYINVPNNWKRIKGKYTFRDRKKDSEKLCIILAGYKEYLYYDKESNIISISKEEEFLEELSPTNDSVDIKYKKAVELINCFFVICV